MSLTVADRARLIATFRFIEVKLMEATAAWTPTTPEMEVKVLFGRHIFDFAQHADWLGRRTFELRKPEHHSVPPVESYLEFLGAVAGEEQTAIRFAALYDVLLPALEKRYRNYISETDTLLDEPSVVIIERIITDMNRMRADAETLRGKLSIERVALDDLAAREGAHVAICA